jgi:PAS domain S-box-containing protein
MTRATRNESASAPPETDAGLRARLTEETLQAIRDGDVDAVVVKGRRGEKIYSLQDTENLYRRLAETVREPMLALSADGSIIFFNNRTQELLRLPPARIAGRRMRELVLKEDRKVFDALLRQTASSGESQCQVHLVTAMDGLIPVQWHANSLERAEEKIICLVGADLSEVETFRETIDELKTQREQLQLMQRELELSREDYADLFDSAPTGYLTLTRSGFIVGINPAAAGLLGMPAGHAIKAPLICYLAKEDRRKFLVHLSLCRSRNDRVSTELQLEPRNGTGPIFVELISKSSPARPTGEVPRIRTIIADITPRKRAELALRDSEKRFRTMADAAPVLIWMADTLEGCNYVNQSWLEFTGRTLEQELAVACMAGVHPDDRERYRRTRKKAFAARREFRMEYRLQRHDGQYRWLLDHGVPRFTENQKFQGYIGSCVDITERREMEAALETASRFPHENPSPVMRLQRGRILSFANPAARNVLRLWRVALGGEAPKSLVRLAVRALARNEQQNCDVVVGTRRFQVWLTPVRKAGYVNVYFSDITARKRAEEALRKAHIELEVRVRERTQDLTRANASLRHQIAARIEADRALRESEERLRLMIEGTRDYAIIMLDARGRVATWNAGAEHITGYRAQEIRGRHFSVFHAPEDVRRGKPRRFLEKARETGRAEEEGWRRRRDGTRYWANAIITALYDERRRLRGFLKVTRDNTERRQAQEVLRMSERNLADFFDHSPLGLLWVEPKGRVRRVNRAALEMFGCTPEECLDHPLQQFHADPASAAELLKLLAHHEPVQNYRTQWRRKDGRIRHVLVDANGLWEHGRMVYSRWFVRDITRRVELEREVLVTAEEEKERLGRDLHDDLCQQLTGIEFLSQTLAGQLRNNGGEPAGRVGEIARMVREAITHTRELARGLSAGLLETLGFSGALQELAASSRKIFRKDCRFHGQRINLKEDPDLAIHLYRIAQEAVSNAIKHGEASRVDISLTRKDGRVVLRIRDNGVGISEGPHKHKGIGLRLMQYRAGVIGGTLMAQRNRNGGTVVTCRVDHSASRRKTT